MDERLRPFDYRLPPQLIARHPPERRDGGRLLVLSEQGIHDRQVVDLIDRVRPGDLLVVNDTRVLHARLGAVRKTGGRIEILAIPDPDHPGQLLAMAKPARRIQLGEHLALCEGMARDAPAVEGLSAELGARRSDGSFELRLHPSPEEVMHRVGRVPLPPYLQREAIAADTERYQTVFKGASGAVAAPTAGLHLSQELVEGIARAGCEIARITLHVGPGTFRSLRSQDLDRGRLHRERFHIPIETAQALRDTRARGGRIIAVGTTSTRTLESAVLPSGEVEPGWGQTDLFIRPGHRFRVVDRLWTNFHLPGSSLLMLACAFGGTERVMAAYAHAVAKGYRFYSYGDAMWIHPSGDGSARGG